MLTMSAWRGHLGDWISIRVQADRTPPRLSAAITFGELPEGWSPARRRARTWAGILGLICIAPFIGVIAATALSGIGIAQPFGWIANSSYAILAATISLFVGIPVAVAVNLWRITRIGVRRRAGTLEGVVAVEFAPLQLIVVLAAVLVGGLFLGHLAADAYACMKGVTTAC